MGVEAGKLNHLSLPKKIMTNRILGRKGSAELRPSGNDIGRMLNANYISLIDNGCCFSLNRSISTILFSRIAIPNACMPNSPSPQFPCQSILLKRNRCQNLTSGTER